MCWKLLWSHFGSEGHQSQEPERKGTAPSKVCTLCHHNKEVVLVSTLTDTRHDIKSRRGAQLHFYYTTRPHLEQKQRDYFSPRWQIFDLEQKIHCLISENSWHLSSCPYMCPRLSAYLCVRVCPHLSVCTRVFGRRWWRMRSRSWIIWTMPVWFSSTQLMSQGMTSSLYLNSMILLLYFQHVFLYLKNTLLIIIADLKLELLQ